MDAASQESLRDTWERMTAPFGTPAAIRLRAWDELVARYAEPDRHYHTLDHIAEVLETLRALDVPPSERPALTFAALLHDVIYDPRASDNEERSAAYARELLQTMGVPDPIRDEAARLIVLTKAHRTDPADLDGQRLLDADLAILGAEPGLYDRYSASIRREYAWWRRKITAPAGRASWRDSSGVRGSTPPTRCSSGRRTKPAQTCGANASRSAGNETSRGTTAVYLPACAIHLYPSCLPCPSSRPSSCRPCLSCPCRYRRGVSPAAGPAVRR